MGCLSLGISRRPIELIVLVGIANNFLINNEKSHIERCLE